MYVIKSYQSQKCHDFNYVSVLSVIHRQKEGYVVEFMTFFKEFNSQNILQDIIT